MASHDPSIDWLIEGLGEVLAEVIQRREEDPFVELGAAAQTIVKDLDVMRARRSNGCPRGS